MADASGAGATVVAFIAGLELVCHRRGGSSNRPLASKDARLPVCALIQHPQPNQNKVLGNRRGEAEACGGNGGLAIANHLPVAKLIVAGRASGRPHKTARRFNHREFRINLKVDQA